MKAIFAGTFDPFTLGHRDIVARAARIFDGVIVAVAEDTGKTAAPLPDRVDIAKLSVGGIAGAEVVGFSGLLTEFIKKVGGGVIVRGLRNSLDYEYERELDAVYKSLSAAECVYLLCAPAHSHISSTTVRQLVGLDASILNYVHSAAREKILSVYKNNR